MRRDLGLRGLGARPRLRVYGPWLAALGAVGLYPWVVGEYWSLNASFVLVYALVALSLTVLTGWVGPVSLAQAAFVGLGAFLSALLSQHGVPWALWLPAAALASLPFSVLVALVSLRLPGAYFAVTTLAFGVVAQYLVFIPVQNFGTTQVARPAVGSVDFGDERLFFLLCVLLVGAGFGATLRIVRGRTGRAFLAVRSSPTSARALGIDALKYKTLAFVLSGAIAADGGVLLGTLIQSARDNQFTPFASIGYVAITIIGGLGSVTGALVAGAVQVLPTELLRPVLGTSLFLTQFQPLLQAGLLVVVIVLYPSGLVGLGRRVGVRAGWLPSRPPRELASIGSAARPHRSTAMVALGEWSVEPGVLGAVLGPPVCSEADLLAAPAALEVDEVTVRFGAVQAIDRVTLSVQPGEVVGIIGPNGAGKTTLFNVCSGFQRPTAGRVLLCGSDITDTPAHLRASVGLGRTFQTPRLVPGMSVRDNLLTAAHTRLRYGLPAEVAGFSYALREEAALGRRVDDLLGVLGFHALADRAAGELPSGLLKVLEVLRALVVVPRVLLLDEPSAGLDPVETEWLGSLVRAINRDLGVAVALIEHDMRLVMGLSDHLYVLEQGRVLREGAPVDVRTDSAVVAAYLGREPAWA